MSLPEEDLWPTITSTLGSPQILNLRIALGKNGKYLDTILKERFEAALKSGLLICFDLVRLEHKKPKSSRHGQVTFRSGLGCKLPLTFSITSGNSIRITTDATVFKKYVPRRYQLDEVFDFDGVELVGELLGKIKEDPNWFETVDEDFTELVDEDASHELLEHLKMHTGPIPGDAALFIMGVVSGLKAYSKQCTDELRFDYQHDRNLPRFYDADFTRIFEILELDERCSLFFSQDFAKYTCECGYFSKKFFVAKVQPSCCPSCRCKCV
jgi:hypothetical protein